MPLQAFILTSLILMAYATLTVVTALLFARCMSLSSAMIVCGFVTLFVDQLLIVWGYIRTTAKFRQNPDSSLFLIFHRSNSRYIFVLALWALAVGFLLQVYH
jgi:hypothetical protein